VPPLGVLSFISLHYSGDFFGPTDTYAIVMEVSMKATMSLFIWLKFLYFLRIFESTGYLIRIIVEVCIDMRFFLALLLLTFVAFGNAIYDISKGNEEPFVKGGLFGGVAFVYRMVLGDFDTT
jgi:hypothetical protein